MKFYITFRKDNQPSGWQTESQKYSLAGLKDLIDKAMFMAHLNTSDTELIYKLVVADKPFDHQLKLSLVNQDYKIVENKLFSGHGSFFPEMFLLFGSKPAVLYMKVESLRAHKNRQDTELSIDAVTGVSKISEAEFKDWNNHISPFE